MCGIVGYIGKKQALPIILNGLQALEYRGYDSAGVALVERDNLYVKKRSGKLKVLINELSGSEFTASAGIGHTRWATHGEPNEINSHPQVDCQGQIAVVHNGIIENYATLRSLLIADGHKFVSATDTEVLVHLIEKFYQGDLLAAVRQALLLVEGAYGLAVISQKEKRKLVVARQGSPLLLGIGKDEMMVASDMTPILPITKNIVFLNDGEIAEISDKNYQVFTLDNKKITPTIQEISANLESVEKSGFKHFMLKEIWQQPMTLQETMRGRLLVEQKKVKLGGIENFLDKILSAKNIILTACGTSWHACLAGEYLLEEFVGLPVEVEYASEFRYRQTPINQDTLLIAVSQSGETADTLAALNKAKIAGALTLGICNVVGSTLARETDAGIYLHAGPEIGVASTKAFTSQVMIFSLLTVLLAKSLGKKIDDKVYQALYNIPGQVEQILKQADTIQAVARIYHQSRNFIYLGRGYNFPVALEGALKLKEISYIHAEGYPAAEMKHGPIALIDKNMPVVFIAVKDNVYDKVISNIEEIRARGGKIITIATRGDDNIKKISDTVIYIPETLPFFMPQLTVVPLQLLAYYIADLKGLDVDKPRNLAKSVTVE